MILDDQILIHYQLNCNSLTKTLPKTPSENSTSESYKGRKSNETQKKMLTVNSRWKFKRHEIARGFGRRWHVNHQLQALGAKDIPGRFQVVVTCNKMSPSPAEKKYGDVWTVWFKSGTIDSLNRCGQRFLVRLFENCKIQNKTDPSTSKWPSRSQSKPSKGIGKAWFQLCHAWNHSAPLNEVSGWGASHPPMVIKCAVGRPLSWIFCRTLATHSRSGMGPLILGWSSSFTRLVLNQKTTFTPRSTARSVCVSLQAPQFCQAPIMGPAGSVTAAVAVSQPSQANVHMAAIDPELQWRKKHNQIC